MWIEVNTEQNIQTFLQGGLDAESVRWFRPDAPYPFPENLGNQLLNVRRFTCSLEEACTTQLDCNNIGSHSVLGLGAAVMKSQWGFFAIAALKNINQQLLNQYGAIKGATISAALATFNIGDFFPKPDAEFGLLNSLSGFGTIFAVVGGFAPVLGPGLAAAGSIPPAIGSFFWEFDHLIKRSKCCTEDVCSPGVGGLHPIGRIDRQRHQNSV